MRVDCDADEMCVVFEVEWSILFPVRMLYHCQNSLVNLIRLWKKKYKFVIEERKRSWHTHSTAQHLTTCKKTIYETLFTMSSLLRVWNMIQHMTRSATVHYNTYILCSKIDDEKKRWNTKEQNECFVCRQRILPMSEYIGSLITDSLFSVFPLSL